MAPIRGANQDAVLHKEVSQFPSDGEKVQAVLSCAVLSGRYLRFSGRKRGPQVNPTGAILPTVPGEWKIGGPLRARGPLGNGLWPLAPGWGIRT